MKQVIFINKQKEREDKPVEFTHSNHNNIEDRWIKTSALPNNYDNVVHRGNDDEFDYFICWDKDSYQTVGIFRGHLNSGKY